MSGSDRERGARRIRDLLPVLAAALGLLVIGANGGCYLTTQGSYLIRYDRQAQDIDSVLASGDLSQEDRAFLDLVQDIKAWSMSRLGLSDDRNYSRYVRIDKEYLVDVVSAAPKDALVPYTWHYPLFGSLPYKGFYRREDALREAERLRKKNLDVLVRKVDAFSTLGWFSDPVYSFMIDYSPYAIANLIIHEQTHATVWIKGSTSFNEQLASFVGDEGARMYVRERYGADSPEYTGILEAKHDREAFISRMHLLRDELVDLYAEGLPEDELPARREALFRSFQARFLEDYDRLFLTDRYRGFARAELNNAYVLLYMTYYEDNDLFERLHRRLGNDLAATVAYLRRVAAERKDPEAALREAAAADGDPAGSAGSGAPAGSAVPGGG